jgi:SOS-response transcriptional repressor LexA
MSTVYCKFIERSQGGQAAARRFQMPKPDRTEKVYQFIKESIQEHGFSPSLREISAATGLTMPVLSGCLAWLEGERRIRRHAGKARSIVLLDPDTQERGQDATRP